MNKIRSGFLFAGPTFFSGAARAFDLGGIYDTYNVSSTESDADYKALLADWSIVGQDIFSAMKQFESALASGSRATDTSSAELASR